ncbi:hypothetical protein [Oceanobacillus jeddahense]|uniref:hypothetical protein n=1 Tax=Oceanobacillus jeddahense TaxID=1462527 RepID=UPI000595F6A9|nr:hypothetical protein [Oceanobacillus jeddahense]
MLYFETGGLRAILRGKTNHPVYSIALLTDASQEEHQDAFYYSFYGTELTYAYNTYRFHEKDPKELKKSDNPFALAVLAGIYASKNKGKKAKDHEKMLRYKQQLLNLAFEKYSHRTNYLAALLYFIDYMMLIPSDLQEQLYETLPIAQNEKEEKIIMGLEQLRDTPTFGRLYREIEEKATKKGLEQGIEQGIKQGKEQGVKDTQRKFVKNLLDRDYAEEEIAELTGLELEEVRKLRKSLEN